MKMNYLTPIICFFFIIQSFAQPTQSRRNVPTDAFKTYEESLTPLEKDSLKNGKIPLVLAQKWELQRQKQLFIQDSILKTMVGQLVPDFEAKDTEGYPHRPFMYKGRVLILHFWNFWDKSFRNEIPALNEIVDKYRKDGVEVLSFVNLKIGESEREYLKHHPVRFPIVENSYQFADAFLPMKIWLPYMIILDKNNNMRFFYKHENLVKINSNFNEKYTEVKMPTFDFEYKIQELLKE